MNWTRLKYPGSVAAAGAVHVDWIAVVRDNEVDLEQDGEQLVALAMDGSDSGCKEPDVTVPLQNLEPAYDEVFRTGRVKVGKVARK